MGCDLVFTRKIEYSLKTELEIILKREFIIPKTLDMSDIPYLKGLYAAGQKEAKILIEAIEKYNEIELEFRC